MTVARFSRKDTLGKQIYTLVDLDFAGMTLRLASVDLDIDSDDLGDLHYHGVLDPVQIDEAMDMFQTGANPSSIQITAVLPVNLPQLISHGHDIGAATGSISRWIEGSSYESRKIVLAGRVQNPEYGSEEEPLNCSIEQSLAEDTSQIPSIRQEVTSLTWNKDYLSDNDLSRPYPVIIGKPGIAASGTIMGSQAIWASKATYHHKLIVANGAVKATSVLINNDNDVTGTTVNLGVDYDNLGQLVTVVDYGAEDYDQGQPNDLGPDYRPAVAEDVSIFVSWGASDGGMVGPNGSCIRSAGEVLEYAFGQMTSKVDLERTGAAKPLLQEFLIDCVIDSRTSMWAWLQGNLLPILPVTIMSGANGIYPIVWRYTATAADAVAAIDLDADESIQRASAVTIDNTNIKNDFALRYGYSVHTQTYTETTSLGVYRQVYAKATLAGYYRDRILLTATSVGNAGAGIEVTTSGGGGLVATESVVDKTVSITYDDGVSTTADIVTEINTTLTSVKALIVQGDGTDVWNSSKNDYIDIPLVLGVTSANGSLHCERSQLRFGVVSDELTSVCVYDGATADLILNWRARAFTLPRRRIDYILPEGEWSWLEPGNVVTLTDSDLYLSAQVCLVEAVQSDESGFLGVRLLFIEDPARDNLSVG